MNSISEKIHLRPIGNCDNSTKYEGKVVEKSDNDFVFEGRKAASIGATNKQEDIVRIKFDFPSSQTEVDLSNCCKRIDGGLKFRQQLTCAEDFDPAIRKHYMSLIVAHALGYKMKLRVYVFNNKPTLAHVVEIVSETAPAGLATAEETPKVGQLYGPYQVTSLSSPFRMAESPRPRSGFFLDTNTPAVFNADERENDVSVKNYLALLNSICKKTQVYITYAERGRVQTVFPA